MDDDLEGLSDEEKEVLERMRILSEEDQKAAVRMLQYLAALPDKIYPSKEEMTELFKQFKHPN